LPLYLGVGLQPGSGRANARGTLHNRAVDTTQGGTGRYEVRIVGCLSPQLVDELTLVEVSHTTTGFTLDLADDAALHVFLRRIEALGLELDSVTRSTKPTRRLPPT
jgi:hypothetical protein